VLSVPAPVRGRYFYLRREGCLNQPVLYWRQGVEGVDQVAVDPNALNQSGTTALDWYLPSEDGRFLAYGISENGSEESVLHLLEHERIALLTDPELAREFTRAALDWLTRRP
jgi:prolyl oligopeptidase